jgi:lipopolysaccharide export system permease protein
MILTRYIVRETVLPFLAGTLILIIIYAIYSAAAILADADGADLAPDIIPYIIYLNTITVLDVILPTALFFSVIYSLGRLYQDSEMIVLAATGISELRILIPTVYLSLAVALGVALISTVCRPWAFRIAYELESQQMAELDIDNLQAGSFMHLERSNHVLYARDSDPVNRRLLDVYLQMDNGSGITRVIRAESMQLTGTAAGMTRPAEFANGHVYMLDNHGASDSVLQFNSLRLFLAGGVPPVGYRRKAENTLDLAHSDKAGDIAEFQKRVSIPVFTILLASLAVPLSRMTYRQGRRTTLALAIVIYTLLFNIRSIALTWIEQKIIPPAPGIWWVPALFAIVLAALLYQPYRSKPAVER